MEYLKNNNLVIKDLLPIISNYLSPTKEEWKESFKECLYDIENLNKRSLYMCIEHYKYITDSEIELDEDECLFVVLEYDSENCKGYEYNLRVYCEELEEEYYLRYVNTSSAISLVLCNYDYYD